MITRIPHPGNMMLVIEPDALARLYERLLAGETWKRLAKDAGCTDTGLKRCLRRAGYDLNIRALRRQALGRTRNVCAVNRAARDWLCRPLMGVSA